MLGTVLEVEQLQQIFKCNNYPVGLIDRCVKTFLNRIYVPKRNFITVPKKDVIIVLPFSGEFSLNLRFISLFQQNATPM